LFGALFCTLAVKFYHALRVDLPSEYPGWVLTDIGVLLTIEMVLTALCLRWPRRKVIRTAEIIAAVVCTWSVMNAGWIIRTGTQILPQVLLPLVRAPLNALTIIGVNLAKMPLAAVVLLGPSAVALTFFFYTLANPQKPDYRKNRFEKKVLITCLIVFAALFSRAILRHHHTAPTASADLRYNCHLKAITALFSHGSNRQVQGNMKMSERKIPAFDRIEIALSQQHINHNVVVVILEGIQYEYTSLAHPAGSLTPFLTRLARDGVEFANARTTLTHTTKALFALMTGRLPSVSQDIAEAVPIEKPYASIATILERKLNYRTAFFQSAKGTFECRPGLVSNLGFDSFFAREDLDDPNVFLGYLACDEFSMLKPVTEWIKSDTGPFFLAVLCSVTHDPYQVPEWFAEPAKEPLERYKQAIAYTDKFIEALDIELRKLGLANNTIFCVIGDHGEAFGEHSLFGHERIAFEEALRIPFCLRGPFPVEAATRIKAPVDSTDLTPTLLALLGFETKQADFDGLNALGPIPSDRKVYFSGWLPQSPAGFVKNNRKFIYNPTAEIVSVYDLAADPCELNSLEISRQQAERIIGDITNWRRDSFFRIDQRKTGQKRLFDHWLCRWTDRISSAKYKPHKD